MILSSADAIELRRLLERLLSPGELVAPDVRRAAAHALGRLGREDPSRASHGLTSPPRRDQSAFHALTRRELEVALLLRQRRSNAELAAVLGISEHTARHHTESVLAKLGLHSRTEVDDYFQLSEDATPRSP